MSAFGMYMHPLNAFTDIINCYYVLILLWCIYIVMQYYTVNVQLTT